MNIRGFLLLLPLLSDVALAIPTTSAPVIVDRIEAIVNKSAIYLSDVKKFRNTSSLRMKVDPLFANNPLSRKQPSDSEIVEYLVSENLILEKFPVNDVELDQEINSIQTNLQISREGLKSAISREGFLFEDYQELMRASISKRQLIDRDIRNKASVSEDELKTEYNKSRSGSKNFQGSIHLHLIKITKKNYKNIKAAKEMLQEAHKELNDGISFSEVAKKTSDDPSSSNGGDLGFLSYQDMNTNLQKEVQKFFNSKTKDKFASFEDDQSLNLIQISEISNDVDSGFEKQRDQLRGKLLEIEFQHQIELWIDRQKSLNYVKINS
jgi:parvulin-like peptidyl-prolyl isomerase